MQLKALFDFVPKKHPLLLISGPCSVETPDQVMETARDLAGLGSISVLRGGIWKPRTRPNSFEGMGEKALPWLAQAAKANNLISATEVANSHHVELCLKNEIDILWLGARTTVNPFSVQEIADSMRGLDIPVFVKNPVNPDIELWIGAIERIYNAGITKIVAVHRGFSTAEKTGYRNAPMWEIPIELKRRFPDLPLICDPSHISGKRDLLFKVSQKAIDLDMQGIMLETHPDPDKALSDAKQQITPMAFGSMLNQLVLKKREGTGDVHQIQLNQMRTEIDALDEKIISLLAQRMEISEKIGSFKKENHMTILQLERWREIFKERTQQGKELGLSESFLQKFLESVHKESIKWQEGKEEAKDIRHKT